MSEGNAKRALLAFFKEHLLSQEVNQQSTSYCTTSPKQMTSTRPKSTSPVPSNGDGKNGSPSGFVLKLFQMVNGAPDDIVSVSAPNCSLIRRLWGASGLLLERVVLPRPLHRGSTMQPLDDMSECDDISSIAPEADKKEGSSCIHMMCHVIERSHPACSMGTIIGISDMGRHWGYKPSVCPLQRAMRSNSSI